MSHRLQVDQNEPSEQEEEEEEEEEDLVSQEQKGHRRTTRLSSVCQSLQLLPLLLCNIVLWYLTNGFNGIAMQSYAKTVRNSPHHSDAFLANVAIVAAVTALQLGLGALLGYVLLTQVLARLITTTTTTTSKSQQHQQLLLGDLRLFSTTDATAASGVLHACGSVFTNIGFLFGSASLVQILKLLEPFETLALSQLLLTASAPHEEGHCTFGIVGSMMVVVGAAVSLIRMRPDKPNQLTSILFAILSGMTLSLRNVLQRKSHHHHHDPSNSSSSSSSSQQQQQRQRLPVLHSSLITTRPSSNTTTQQSQTHDLPEPSPNTPSSHHSTTTTTTTTKSTPSALEKLERSLLQFTQLSLKSFVLVSAMAIALHLAVLPLQLWRAAVDALTWRVLLWHPLYNVFSMITLGFCSALTHSLLNAGKRVFAIVLAITWFGEELSPGTIFGLLTVLCGGVWYTVESSNLKQQQQQHVQRRRRGQDVLKVPLAVLILTALFQYQSMYRRIREHQEESQY